MTFDVVSIGDAVFDTYLSLHDANLHCRTDNSQCELCLKYGEKILVDRVDRAVGGNAPNNAVGLTRLGLKTGLLTVLGDDQIGTDILAHLKNEGVDLSLSRVQSGTESRFSTIINFKDQKTALEYQVSHQYVLLEMETKWVYISSVGPNYQDFYHQVVDQATKNNWKIFFAPGTAQIHGGKETISEMLSHCEAVSLNKEEAEKILQVEPSVCNGHLKNLLSSLYDLGPKVVSITDGTNGSFAYDGANYYFLPIVKVPTMSATGAGDAYASGFMAGLIEGKQLTEAMRMGMVNSAAVVQKIGPQTGLLTSLQMQEELDKHVELKANEI